MKLAQIAQLTQAAGLAALVSSSFVHAAETEPVMRAGFAVQEARLVLALIKESTEQDRKIDKMCMRLGRLSAIYRRIRGSVPPPPEETLAKFVHYESFCGWGESSLIPRGAEHPEAMVPLEQNLLIDTLSLENYIRENSKNSIRAQNHTCEEQIQLAADFLLSTNIGYDDDGEVVGTYKVVRLSESAFIAKMNGPRGRPIAIQAEVAPSPWRAPCLVKSLRFVE